MVPNQQTDCTVSHRAVWEIKLRLHLVWSPVWLDLVWSLACVSFIELFETQPSPAASSLVPGDKEMKGSMNIHMTLLIPLKFSLVATIFSLPELSRGIH